MTKMERENWLCNIQNTADAVSKELGWETVRFVLQEYGGGATSIERLSPSYYEAVWIALFQYFEGSPSKKQDGHTLGHGCEGLAHVAIRPQ